MATINDHYHNLRENGAVIHQNIVHSKSVAELNFQVAIIFASKIYQVSKFIKLYYRSNLTTMSGTTYLTQKEVHLFMGHPVRINN